MVLCANAYADVSFGTGEAPDCDLAKAYAVSDAIERYAEKEFGAQRTADLLKGRMRQIYAQLHA